MPDDTPPDSEGGPSPLLELLAILERDKTSGRIDQIMTRDITLLLAMINVEQFSEEAIKANVRTEVNASIAARLIMGP